MYSAELAIRISTMRRQLSFQLLAILITLASPSVSMAAGDVFKGKEVYQRHCMGCHGGSGEGIMPGMPNFARGDRLFRTDRELEDAIRDGNGVMPSFNGLLDDDDMRDVVAFLRTFL